MRTWRTLAGACLMLIAGACLASEATAAVYSKPDPIEFTTGAPHNGSVYPSTIDVPETGTVTDVNVTLHDVSHTFPDDVGVILVSPAGTAFLLQAGAGSDTDLNGVTYTLDDEAPTRLPSTGAWSDGSYGPAAYYQGDFFPAPGPGTDYAKPGPNYGAATLVSTFGGQNALGQWHLYTRDFVMGDGGSIAGGWSLDLKTSATTPETTLDSGPPAITNSATASFAFSSDRPGSFECSLDGGIFETCKSPKGYSGLSEGSHEFRVRALDIRDVADPSPPSVEWTVDTTAPVATIDSGPTGTIYVGDASFAFSADEPADFLCKLNDAPFTACTSPMEYTGLADGPHSFAVRAVDQAGNVDSTGAAVAFNVVSSGPEPVDKARPSIALTKKRLRKQRGIVARFSGDDDLTPRDQLTFTCRIDDGTPEPCTSPAKFTGLSVGRHTIAVVATDLAGKTSRTASKPFQIKKKKAKGKGKKQGKKAKRR